MKITNQTNSYGQNYKPNFGEVCLVQVSKKAFGDIVDPIKVVDVFEKTTNKIVKDIPDKLAWFLNKFGKAQKYNKVFMFWEQPCLPEILKEQEKEGNFSLNWLSQNVKVPIKGQMREDYHSFFLYTKEHKDASWLLHGKKMENERDEFIAERYVEQINAGNNNADKEVWTYAMLNNKYIEDYEKIGKPTKRFEIQDLSELLEVFKKIDY